MKFPTHHGIELRCTNAEIPHSIDLQKYPRLPLVPRAIFVPGSFDFLSWPCTASAPFSSGAYVLVLAEEEVAEGLFEGGVTKGVAGGVNGGVDVAEPVANSPHGIGHA